MIDTIIKLLNSDIEEDVHMAMYLLGTYSNEDILRLLEQNLSCFDEDSLYTDNLVARYHLNTGKSIKKYFKIDKLYLYRGYRQLIIRPKKLFPNDVITIR